MRALIAIVALAGCVSPDSVQCADGSVCPRDRACHLIADSYQCVSDEQIAACDGRADLAPCSGGTCLDGVCIAPSCGDERIGPIEVCDDGNVANGDGCSSDCRSDETCGNGIIDLQVGEQCDDGSEGVGLSHDGCSSICLMEHPEWRVLPDYGEVFTSALTSSSWAITYDLARGRVVALASVQGRLHTMEYDGAVWTDVSPLVGPTDRIGFAIAYDARRRRTVMFGGLGFRDTWEWDGAVWSLVQPATVPPARAGLVLAYDPIHERVVAYGGRAGLQGMHLELDDTWVWDGTTWTPITNPGPPRRAEAAMTFDPARGVLLLYGGLDATDALLADTWELDGDTWTRQTAATGPGARQTATMAFDPATQRVLLYGGRGTSPVNTTYAWNGTTWVLAATDVTDPGRTKAVTLIQEQRVLLIAVSGMFEWSGTGWTKTMAPLQGGFRFTNIASAVDTAGRRILAFGGLLGGAPSNTTTMWRGLWALITSTEVPSPRLDAAMAYDEARGEFVLFGGSTATDIIGDTWVFDGAWHERTPATSPPARASTTLVYDPVRSEIVMFGGIGALDYGDTWTWNGSTWTEIPGAGPPARSGHTATYDPIRHEVLIFGGSPTFDLPPLGDTWAWNGTWTKRADTGPAPRFATAMAWDPARARVMLFGGNNSQSDFNDAWEWDGTSWTQLAATATSPHNSHGLVSAIDGAGVVRFGIDRMGNKDTADLRWTTAGREEVCVRGMDFDGDGLGAASCTDDPDCWRICTPRCPPGTSCAAGSVGCGDGTCTRERESCLSCPEDCGACAPTCGDLACTGAETHATCAADCP